MINAISVSMVLTGTFIGAGFASGQEIIQYFGIFGKIGILGILLSCVLLTVFTYCTIDNICVLGERDYIKALCKYKWVNFLINGYMLLIFGTMINAFGECLNQMYDIPKIYGVFLINLATIIILYFGGTAVIKFNTIITPLIIAGIFVAFFSDKSASVFNNFGTSAVIYTSYNIITMPFVILGMKNLVNSKKSSALCSIIFGIIIFILALCLFMLLGGIDGESVQIPLLSVVSDRYAYIMFFVLAMSMVTTAVSNGYGLINTAKFSQNTVIIFLFVFALFFSTFKFSFIVKYLYMAFGYMGLYVLIINFWIYVKNREKPRKIEINKNN